MYLIDQNKWNIISSYQILNQEILYKYHKKLKWKIIFEKQNLSEQLIRKYKYKVNHDLSIIIKYQNVSEKFLIDYNSKVGHNEVIYLLENYKLSENYLNFIINSSKSWWDCYEFMYDKENAFNKISRYQILSENFIEKYKNNLNWKFITIYQKLSEKFIEKYNKNINWDFVSIRQKISPSFLKKYNKNIKWINVSKILSQVNNLNEYISNINLIKNFYIGIFL